MTSKSDLEKRIEILEAEVRELSLRIKLIEIWRQQPKAVEKPKRWPKPEDYIRWEQQ